MAASPELPATTPALPQLAQSKSQILGPLPARSQSENRASSSQRTPRVPPRLIRLATLKVRDEDAPDSSRKAPPPLPLFRKVHTWEDAMTARPPLQIDMDGPTPCTYSPRNKPTSEKNAPSYTFGRKTMPSKEGSGGRTSWSKQWFASPHIWCDKVNFHSERKWPGPNQYNKRQLLGPRQPTSIEAPSFTIGTRQAFSLIKKGVEKEPSPNEYDTSSADKLLYARGAAFTHSHRKETILWPSKENTPGPGRYDPSLSYCRPSRRAFTIHNNRKPGDHTLGPFAIF